ESKLEESEFAGLQIPDGPFSQNDINHGYNYFMGFKKLENGGPSCVSCHTVRGIPSFGGGRFGPDLTKVYERLEGRVGLVMWMSAPATTTMQPIFEDHPLTMEENLALVAYLEDAAQNGGEDSALGTMVFFLVGMGGMLFGLALFSAVWFRRFKAVRRPLVEK
ncbi:MAG: hypothetical protein GY771_00330, partial [bacterium]|nr:hypothetical protein [bacterium]